MEVSLFHPIVPKYSFFFDEAKSHLFKNVLTACVLKNSIGVDRKHPQLLKSVFDRQLFRLRPITFALHGIVLHVNTQRTLFPVAVNLL